MTRLAQDQWSDFAVPESVDAAVAFGFPEAMESIKFIWLEQRCLWVCDALALDSRRRWLGRGTTTDHALAAALRIAREDAP